MLSRTVHRYAFFEMQIEMTSCFVMLCDCSNKQIIGQHDNSHVYSYSFFIGTHSVAIQ